MVTLAHVGVGLPSGIDYLIAARMRSWGSVRSVCLHACAYVRVSSSCSRARLSSVQLASLSDEEDRVRPQEDKEEGDAEEVFLLLCCW